MSLFRCPECLAELVAELATLHCPSCASIYPVQDGLPMLCRQRDFYYGEIPRPAMQHLVARAAEAGWRQALMEHADAANNLYFYNYAASETRSSFKFLLDRLEGSTALDYGCGPGAVALSLARNFAHVYALDLTPERVQFARLHAEQEGFDNVTAFCAGDTPHVPLADGAVDAVILNGVLEWIPGFRPGRPRAVQIEFLRELRRVLKPSGYLFIGIENRIGYEYFRGRREDHTGLRYASLLPRPLADLYSRIVRGKPFRTYTYSRHGYRSLLRSAGLPATEFFGLIPDYRNIEKAFRASSPAMIHALLQGKRGAMRVRNALAWRLAPATPGSFGILAASQPLTPFYEKLTDQISRLHLGGARLQVETYSVTPWTAAVHLRASTSTGSYYIKLPLSAHAEARMREGVEGARAARISAGQSADQLLMPWPLTWGTFQGQAYLLEPAVAGTALDKLAPEVRPSAFGPQIVEYLVRLGSSSRVPGGSWAQLLERHASRLAEALADHYRRRGLSDPRCEQKLNAIVRYLESAAGDSRDAARPGIERPGMERPGFACQGFECPGHGDFWHGNLLVEVNSRRLTAVLDWDGYEPRSLPFLDAFHLLVKDTEVFHTTPIGKVIVDLHRQLTAGGKTSPTVADILEPYAARMGLELSLAPLCLMVYWMRLNLIRLSAPLPSKISALEEAIDQPLNYFYSVATKNSAAAGTVDKASSQAAGGLGMLEVGARRP